MVEKLKVSIETENGYTLEHSFLKHTMDVEALVIIYPGGNYTCERPLLHYLRKLSLNKKYDVLSINYGTCFLDHKFGVLLFEDMYFETKKAVEVCLNQRSYKKIYLIGKSLGSVLIGKIRSEYQLDYQVKQIYLTPVKETIPYINSFKGLVFTGTKDRLFSHEMVNLISAESKANIHVIEGASHSLELQGKVTDTIDLHKNIINMCDAYLSE